MATTNLLCIVALIVLRHQQAASQPSAGASILRPYGGAAQLQHLRALDDYEAELSEYAAGAHFRSKRQAAANNRESLLRDHIRMLKRFAAVVSGNDTDVKSTIERKLFANATSCARKIAVFTGGGSASGKSSLTRFWHPIMEASSCGFVLIDPDDIMMELPEWSDSAAQHDKCAAGNLHKLGSDWAEDFYAKALNAGLNIVLDGTMKNDVKILKQAKDLRKKGYEIHVIAVTSEVATAAQRAWERGERNNRYVALCALLATHAKFSANFDKYRTSFEDLTLFDTNDVRNTTLIYQNKTIFNEPAYARFLAKANLTDDQLQKQLSPETAQSYEELNRTCNACSPKTQPTIAPKAMLVRANHAAKCCVLGDMWLVVAGLVVTIRNAAAFCII